MTLTSIVISSCMLSWNWWAQHLTKGGASSSLDFFIFCHSRCLCCVLSRLHKMVLSRCLWHHHRCHNLSVLLRSRPSACWGIRALPPQTCHICWVCSRCHIGVVLWSSSSIWSLPQFRTRRALHNWRNRLVNWNCYTHNCLHLWLLKC